MKTMSIVYFLEERWSPCEVAKGSAEEDHDEEVMGGRGGGRGTRARWSVGAGRGEGGGLAWQQQQQPGTGNVGQMAPTFLARLSPARARSSLTP